MESPTASDATVVAIPKNDQLPLCVAYRARDTSSVSRWLDPNFSEPTVPFAERTLSKEWQDYFWSSP